MLRQFLLLAALVLSGVSFADNVTFLRIDKAIVQQRVQQAPQRPEQRVEVLRGMFEKAGCAARNIQIQPVPELSLPNVICTLPGTESGTILIGASLDYDQRGETGTVGWGSVAMLPLLAESLTSSTHRHSLVFVAFAGQAGAGSAWYLKNLNDTQRRDIRGMVDLDHVGRTAAGYATPTNDKVLERLLPAAARALQIKPEPPAVADVPDSDATIFQHAHIPAITIYSPGYLANATDPNAPPAMVTPVLLGQVQNISAIPPRSFVLKTALDPTAYNDTYNLLCVYALFLDRGLGTGRRPSAEVMRAAASTPAAPGATEAANSTAGSMVADSKPAYRCEERSRDYSIQQRESRTGTGCSGRACSGGNNAGRRREFTRHKFGGNDSGQHAAGASRCRSHRQPGPSDQGAYRSRLQCFSGWIGAKGERLRSACSGIRRASCCQRNRRSRNIRDNWKSGEYFHECSDKRPTKQLDDCLI